MGAFLQRRGYQVKVFNSIDFSKSMHYNPLSYIHNEADILKFVDTLIANTKGEGKEGDPFWTKAETLLYCALIAYIIFEAPAEDRNINTLVDMISGMDVKEDDESYMNAVDYMFKGLEKRKPDCFAVKQYKKYKLASGVVCSKRLLNQAVGKSLRTHNLKPKKGAQVMRKNEKITALYERLSRDDFGKDDDQQRESNSISNQKAKPVGFLMIGFDVDDYWTDAPEIAKGNYNLWRLMIDKAYQNRGYGKEAVSLALEFIKSMPCGEAEYCWLSYEPDNAVARQMYHSFGFEETGEMDGEELIAVLRL